MSMASTPDGRQTIGEIDVSMAPADLKIPRWCYRTRLLSSTLVVAAVGLLALSCSTPTVSAPPRTQPSPRQSSPRASTPPATAAGTAPWELTSSIAPFTLPAAVSRPTVYASGNGLLVVGGLTAADSTTQSILLVDLARQAVRPAGRLPVPVHDAAGAMVRGRDLLFGCESTAVSSAVQDVAPGTTHRLISHLPAPRADLVAISDGTAAYVLGGFDGQQGSATILRTIDGTTFTVVGTAAVTVRYPAVAASGGSIWLFGGEHAGKQITDVQRIDLATGRGRVTGHLPRPLAHAGAFTLGGSVFIAGGRTSSTVADTVLRFDTADLRFTAVGHLPAARSDFGVAVVGAAAYLIGGESPKPVNTLIQVRAHAGGTP